MGDRRSSLPSSRSDDDPGSGFASASSSRNRGFLASCGSSSSSSDFPAARRSGLTTAKELRKADSTAFSTNAKNENGSAAALDSEGNPFKKLRFSVNPTKSGGSGLSGDEMPQDRSKNRTLRIHDVPTVPMSGKELLKQWRRYHRQRESGEEVAVPAIMKGGSGWGGCCPQCGCSGLSRIVSVSLSPQYGCSGRMRTASEPPLLSLPPPASSNASLLSTATSPITHNLTASDIPPELSKVFHELRCATSCTTPSSHVGLSTFHLDVFVQEVPLPSPLPNPLLTLRVCLLECCTGWYSYPSNGGNATPNAACPDGKELEFSRRWESAEAQSQISVERLLCLETALSDVERLLTLLAYHSGSCGCCSQDSPWVSMPTGLLALDAVEKIQAFLHRCHQSRLLKICRIICHMEITAYHAEHKRIS